MSDPLALRLATAIDGLWRQAPVAAVGPSPRRGGEPDVVVLVGSDAAPRLRVEVHEARDEASHARLAMVWQGQVVVAVGERVHLVSLADLSVTSHALGAYLGALQGTPARLIVATAERLVAIDPGGAIAWTSSRLGVDGVVWTEVGEAEIHGAGEWDPPGGWRSFRICAYTGRLLR